MLPQADVSITSVEAFLLPSQLPPLQWQLARVSMGEDFENFRGSEDHGFHGSGPKREGVLFRGCSPDVRRKLPQPPWKRP